MVTIVWPVVIGAVDHAIDRLRRADRSAGLTLIGFSGGGADTVVPASVLDDYIARLPAGHQALLSVVQEANHSCCWHALWANLVRESSSL